MYGNPYKQKVTIGVYQFNSYGSFSGLLKMEATATARYGGQVEKHFVSNMRIDDDKVTLIKASNEEEK